MGLIPGLEDTLEKKMATHSSILAWKIPYGAWQATVHGVTKSLTRMSTHACKHDLPEGFTLGKMTALEIKLYSSTWELFVKYESADHRAPSFHLGIRGCYGTRKFQFHADGQNHPNKLGYGTELILCWLFLWNRSRLTQGVPHRHENMSC